MNYQRDRWAPSATTLTGSTTLRPGVAYKYSTSGGAIAQTLPQASTLRPGQSFWVKLVGIGSALTISPFAGDTINGSSSSTIFQNLGESALFVRDSVSTNWLVFGRGLPAFFSQYSIVALSAAQSLRIVVNNHVEMNQLINVRGMPTGLVTLTTGAGQANGLVTLNSRRYWVSAIISGSCNEGEITMNWTTTGGGGGAVINEESGLPSIGLRLVDPVTPDAAPFQINMGIFDARSASITMEMRFQVVTNPINLAFRAYIVPLA